MTLLVAIKGEDGLALAADSRVTFGDPRGGPRSERLPKGPYRRAWRRLRAVLAEAGRQGTAGQPLAFLHLPRTGGIAIRYHLELGVGKRNVARVPLPPDFLGQLGKLRSTRVVVGHFFYPMSRLLPSHPVATVLRDPVERTISVWEYLHWRTHHPDHQHLTSGGIKTIEEFATDELLAPHVRDNQTRLLGAEYDIESIVASLEAREIDLSEANRLAAEAESRPADSAMLERAKGRLEGMRVVGLTEDLDAFVRRLELAIGLPPRETVGRHNATPLGTVDRRPDEYNEGTRRRLAELNPFDSELHSFARGLVALERPTSRAS